jgi:hypothetical protein
MREQLSFSIDAYSELRDFSRDGDTYAGQYCYHKATNTVTGCPARAKIVKDAMKSVSLKEKEKAVPRQHAEAMMIEELAQMMTYSESQVSSEEIDALIM